MRKTLFVGLGFIFSSLINAQSDDSILIKRLSDEILRNGQAYENLRVLTKKVGPRLAGSPGMVKAEQWGLRMMKETGADKAWMQECMVPHWVRGGTDQALIVNENSKQKSAALSRSFDVVALGNSIGTGNKGLKAPVIMVESFEELEKKKEQVKDRIVFYNAKFDPTYINTFSSYRDAGKFRGQGPSKAAQYGAVAVIIRSLSHSTDNFPHTGATKYDSNYAKIPAVAIGLRDADWLGNKLSTGEPVNIFLKTLGHFLPDTIGHNIIGELKGSDFPEQIITVGGHLDCWDNCEGAHDDGAGCVQTIEVLRAFKAIGYKPKRTIRFVLFANEENGLRGGRKYAEEAALKNEKHIFALESDAGGFTPRGFSMSGTDQQYEKFEQWKTLIAPYGCTEFSKGGGGADIGPLKEKLGTVVAGFLPDSQRYFDFHHARNDVFEAVNKRELELGAVNIAALIYLVDKYGMD